MGPLRNGRSSRAACIAIVLLAAIDATALMRQRGSAAPSDEASTPYARAEEAAARGDCATALPLLEEALAADGDDPDALALRGYCLRKGGKLDEAFESYRRALDLRPEFPAARQYLGEAHLQAALREVEILRGYGESGREELGALVKAFAEAVDRLERRNGPATAPAARW